MLYLLLTGSLILMVINFLLGDCDFLYPSFIFCLVFSAAEFVCVLGKNAYEIVLHPETVLTILCGEIVFTLIAYVSGLRRKKKNYCVEALTIEKIYVNKILIGGTIILQLLAIIFFIKYLKNISMAYDGATRSLTELISLYDIMTKFWTDIFNQLSVPVPMIYRIANPIVSAAAYLSLYIVVNNFVATKKIETPYLVIIFLQCILIILNGSRSPLFRVLTMVVMLLYVMLYWRGKIKKGDIRLFLKLAGLVIGAALFFIVLLNIMGRSGKGAEKIMHYLFVYVGAPIVNLDNFIIDRMPSITTSLFGEQTFRSLYNYVGKLFHISQFSYGGVNPFVFSSNGIEIGNVFTTFYSYLYDFRFAGVAPLTALVAVYYVFTYRGLTRYQKNKKKINLQLYFYAYLFNDLIMQSFSSRFYETVLDAPFIKLFILSIAIDIIFIEHKLKIGKYFIKIPKVAGRRR